LREVLQVTQRFWSCFPQRHQRFLLAAHYLREAKMYLDYFPSLLSHWNRKKGILRLVRALSAFPRIALTTDFLKLARRALLPRLLHRTASRETSPLVSAVTLAPDKHAGKVEPNGRGCIS